LRSRIRELEKDCKLANGKVDELKAELDKARKENESMANRLDTAL